MTIDEVIALINEILPKPLTSLQEEILRQAWEGQTYADIAEAVHYQEAYIKNTASQLWQEMSQLFSEPITKTNFRSKLSSRSFSSTRISLSGVPIEFPGVAVPLNSIFYIERPAIEELAYTEASKPGSLIQIRAPRKMGKTSLLIRILAHTAAQGSRIVFLNLQEADRAVFISIDKFLRWLCLNISRMLNLQPTLNNIWNDEMGSKVSCNLYFQQYLLKTIDAPLILALDELNQIFKYPLIAQDFLPLLRLWHERAKQSQIWQKLRLVTAYSTEIFPPQEVNETSFDAGLVLNLPRLTLKQVQELALRHGLTWVEGSAGIQNLVPLQQMVDGHPYLIQLAFYYLSRRELSLEQLLQEAPTSAGIYSNFLRSHIVHLQEQPRLAVALKQVVSAASETTLEIDIAHRLANLGLIELNHNQARPSCELFRLYFSQQLPELEQAALSDASLNNKNYLQQLERENQDLQRLLQLHQLEQENLQLQRLSKLDPLTQVANRRGFDQKLEQEWRRLSRRASPLSLILCDIDYFKSFNEINGHQAGDVCLQQIAKIMQSCVQRSADLVARYGGEEFAVLLPETDAVGAFQLAEKIREYVKLAAIPRNTMQLDSLVVTVSLGVASAIPSPLLDRSLIIRAADEALYLSKQQGRDYVTLSSTFNFGATPD